MHPPVITTIITITIIIITGEWRRQTSARPRTCHAGVVVIVVVVAVTIIIIVIIMA